MSWKTVNEILALASVDPSFREAFQHDPISAVETQGFELTGDERQVFQACRSLTLVECCRVLLERLAPLLHEEA
jgi:hypothetical protein